MCFWKQLFIRLYSDWCCSELLNYSSLWENEKNFDSAKTLYLFVLIFNKQRLNNFSFSFYLFISKVFVVIHNNYTDIVLCTVCVCVCVCLVP